MKLRAPRCSEASLATSLLAGSLNWEPPPAAVAWTEKEAAAAATSVTTILALAMVDDPLRHRFGFLDLRVERHQQEEREVHHREYPRQQRVQAGRGLHSEITQHEEADDEGSQRALVDHTPVTDGPDLAAVQPGQEQRQQHGRAHQDDAEQLVR